MSLAPVPASGWLTLQDISDELGIPLSTVRDHRRRGLLKATKPGGVWFVRPEWFEEYTALADEADRSAKPAEPVKDEQTRRMSAALDAILTAAEAVAAVAGPLKAEQNARLASLLGGA